MSIEDRVGHIVRIVEVEARKHALCLPQILGTGDDPGDLIRAAALIVATLARQQEAEAKEIAP